MTFILHFMKCSQQSKEHKRKVGGFSPLFLRASEKEEGCSDKLRKRTVLVISQRRGLEKYTTLEDLPVEEHSHRKREEEIY